MEARHDEGAHRSSGWQSRRSRWARPRWGRADGKAERRPHPRRRPGLDRPRLLRQRPVRDAATSTGWRATGMRFTAGLRRLHGLLADAAASLLTGKYPARLHITDWIPGQMRPPTRSCWCPTGPSTCPLEEVTLAEAFQAAGYATGQRRQVAPRAARATDPEKHGFDLQRRRRPTGASPVSYFAPCKIPTLPEGPRGRVPDRPPRRRGRALHRGEQGPAVLPLPAALRRPHPDPGASADAGREVPGEAARPG